MTAGEIISAAGLGVSIIGFTIAVYQIVQTRRQSGRALTVAEATQKAVADTQRLAAINELLLLIPQMQRLEREISDAARAKDRGVLVDRLADWRALAPQASGLFHDGRYEAVDLRSRLHESATVSAQAISDLSDDSTDVAVSAKRAITVIAGACEQAGVVLGRLKAQPGGTQ